MDEALEQLLLQFGLDLSPLKVAAGEIQSTLDKLSSYSDVVADKAVKGATEQAQQMAQFKKAAADAVQIAKLAIINEQAKAQVIKTQTAEFQKQTAEQIKNTAEAKATAAEENAKKAATQASVAELGKELAARRAETAEIQKQIVELRKKRLEEKESNSGGSGHGEGGGGGSGFFSKIAGAALGTGLAGSVTTGLLAGGGIVLLLETATSALEHFIEKSKEAVTEAGKLTLIQDQFEKLARGIGETPSKVLDELTEKTEGLVSKVDLLRLANAGMKAGMSTEAIANLTGAVAKLAEGTGKTATQGVERLTIAMARGNPAVLAMVTGLTRAQLAVGGIPAYVDKATKSQLQWTKATEILVAKAAAVGDVPETFEKAAARTKVAFENITSSFGRGLNASAGTQIFLEVLKGNTIAISELSKKAEQFGDRLGKVFAAGAAAGAVLKAVFGAIADVVNTVFWPALDLTVSALKTVGSLLKSVGADLTGLMSMDNKSGNGPADAIKTIGHALFTVAMIIESIGQLVSGTIKEVVAGVGVLGSIGRLQVKVAKNGNITFEDEKGRPSVGESIQTWKDSRNVGPAKDKQDKESGERWGKQIADFDDSVDTAFGKKKKESKIDPDDARHEASLQQQVKMAQLRMKLEEAQAKTRLQIKESELAKEKELDASAYRDGLKALDQHLADERALANTERQNKNAEAGEDFTAREKELRFTEGKTSPKATVDLQVEILRETQRQKVLKNEEAYQARLRQIDDQGDKDRTAAAHKRLAEALAIELEGIKALQTANEKAFSNGAVTPDEYFQQEIVLIRARTAAQVENANLVYQAGIKNDTNRAAAESTQRKAYADGERELTAVIESEVTKRLSYLEKQYQPQQKALESQFTRAKETPAGIDNNAEAVGGALQVNLELQKQELEALIETAKPYPDLWLSIFDKIEATTQQQTKLNAELLKMHDIMTPVAGLFEGLAKDVQQDFHSKFAQNLGASIEAGARSLSQSTQRTQVITGAGEQPKDPALVKLEAEATALFDKATTSASTVAKPFNSLVAVTNEVIAAFGKLKAAATPNSVDTVGDDNENDPFLNGADESPEGPKRAGAWQVTQNAKTSSSIPGASTIKAFTDKLLAGAGAVSDFITSITTAKTALSGAFGGGVGGAGLGQVAGGVMSSMGGMLGKLGPYGAAAGAAIGLVTGGITGAKQAAVTKNINDLNKSFKDLMTDFSDNTNNLQSTIVQLSELTAKAQQMQASSKKGGAQYQQAIDQYVQQMKQLQAQQIQTMYEMREQLAVVLAPPGIQDQLTSLDEILKKYQKFAGAAETVQDLADANNLLTASLEQYGQTLQDTMVTNEETAINDALHLNQLLLDRYNLMNQLNVQIEGVLSQGVLTRQRTFAETKGEQIAQLQYQAELQLEQMNNEIALTQYKVDGESKIFNLSTTRVGLEAQLLALQETQTNLDLSRIAALSSLVTALQTGNIDFGPLMAVINSLPGVSTPVGGTASGSTLAQIIAGAYQNRASLGYAGYTGTGL